MKTMEFCQRPGNGLRSPSSKEAMVLLSKDACELDEDFQVDEDCEKASIAASAEDERGVRRLGRLRRQLWHGRDELRARGRSQVSLMQSPILPSRARRRRHTTGTQYNNYKR